MKLLFANKICKLLSCLFFSTTTIILLQNDNFKKSASNDIKSSNNYRDTENHSGIIRHKYSDINSQDLLKSAIYKQNSIDNRNHSKSKVVINNQTENKNGLDYLRYGYYISYYDYDKSGVKKQNIYRADGNTRSNQVLGSDDKNSISDPNGAYIATNEIFNIKIQIDAPIQPNVKVVLNKRFKYLIQYQALLNPSSIWYSIEAVGILSCPKISLVEHITSNNNKKTTSFVIGQYGVYNFFNTNASWAIPTMIFSSILASIYPVSVTSLYGLSLASRLWNKLYENFNFFGITDRLASLSENSRNFTHINIDNNSFELNLMPLSLENESDTNNSEEVMHNETENQRLSNLDVTTSRSVEDLVINQGISTVVVENETSDLSSVTEQEGWLWESQTSTSLDDWNEYIINLKNQVDNLNINFYFLRNRLSTRNFWDNDFVHEWINTLSNERTSISTEITNYQEWIRNSFIEGDWNSEADKRLWRIKIKSMIREYKSKSNLLKRENQDFILRKHSRQLLRDAQYLDNQIMEILENIKFIRQNLAKYDERILIEFYTIESEFYNASNNAYFIIGQNITRLDIACDWSMYLFNASWDVEGDFNKIYDINHYHYILNKNCLFICLINIYRNSSFLLWDFANTGDSFACIISGYKFFYNANIQYYKDFQCFREEYLALDASDQNNIFLKKEYEDRQYQIITLNREYSNFWNSISILSKGINYRLQIVNFMVNKLRKIQESILLSVKKVSLYFTINNPNDQALLSELAKIVAFYSNINVSFYFANIIENNWDLSYTLSKLNTIDNHYLEV